MTNFEKGEAILDRIAERINPEKLEPIHLARMIHGDELGLVRWQGQFFRWTSGAYMAMSDDAVRTTIYRAFDCAGAKPNRNRVSDVADALRSVAYLDDGLQPPVWLSTRESPGPGVVAVGNGLLDILSRELTPPNPDLFTLEALPVEYEPQATAPSWDKFLAALWPDDPSSIECLQEVFGYLVAGDTSQQKIILLVGPRRGGKGTILRVLNPLMGRDSVAALTLGSLSGPFGLQPLIGKLVAVVSDARLGARADQEAIAERLLSVSGEDFVGIPRKFMPDFTAQLKARFVLATNELPKLHDASGALASRFIPLVLTRSWYGREDKTLTATLTRELPGILNWAIDGYIRLCERGHFQIPESAKDAVRELDELGSPIRAFLADRCTLEPGTETLVRHVYQAWCDWCEEHGRKHPGTEQSFGRDLRAAAPGVNGSQVRRDGERVRVYQGIKLGVTPECHAVSRVTNHYKCAENNINECNASARVTTRDTSEWEEF